MEAKDAQGSFASSPLTSFNDPRLTWLKGQSPDSWAAGLPDGAGPETEGFGGSSEVSGGSDTTLVITPPSKKDYWRRTFYEPTMIKGDAPALVAQVPASEECTLEACFSFTPQSQFDQVGLFVYLDETHWLKTGIEFADGTCRLSVVCCNTQSDWSVMPWDGKSSAKLRIHKINHANSVVVEACHVGDGGGDGGGGGGGGESSSLSWQFVRICHLGTNMANLALAKEEPTAAGSVSAADWHVGPFAACSLEQRGCRATFTQFSITGRKSCTHESEGNEFGDQ